MSAPIQARTVTDAFWALDPYPHPPVGPAHPFFADLERLVPRTHYGVAHKLSRLLSAAPGRPEFVHVGLIGHAGLGKTTLVKSALARLSGEGIRPVYINAIEVVDQQDYTFSDMMLVLAEAVIQDLVAAKVTLPASKLDAVRCWFAEEVLLEKHSKQIVGSLEVEAGAEASIPFLAALSTKIKAALKSDNEYRQEIRRRTQRDPRELIRRVNLLLDAAHEALAPRGAKLCVVWDNLEKTEIELVDRAVLARSDEYRRLRTNAILFFNPACEYSPLTTPASRAFACVTVPVLPVRFPGDPPDELRAEALGAIEAMLDRRVLLEAVFDDPKACVGALAHWSGGHIRDLLLLARRAVENVEPEKITVRDIEHAATWLGGHRISSLRPEDFARAVELHHTNHILDTEQDRRMLKNSCVLPYDGTEWWDIHPCVRGHKLFQSAMQLQPSA